MANDIHISAAALEMGARAKWNERRRLAAISGRPGASRMPSWDALGPQRQSHLLSETRAAFNAIVKAWPGMEVKLYWRSADEIILPLTEKPDGE